jgi:cyanophycinase
LCITTVWSQPSPYHSIGITGDPADVKTKTQPGIVLMGGGGDVEEALAWMIRLSGGGDFIILRASGSTGYNDFIKGLGNVNSVETLLLDTREKANAAAVGRRIREAEAVFIAGGDQWNYVKHWSNSEVSKALEYLIREKKVPIGGTSAGCAVLSGICFDASHDTAISKAVLTNPYDSTVSLSRSFIDFPILRNVVADQHYSQRHRQGRHVTFLARMITDMNIPDARGIGVDERTAVCVDAKGNAVVFGRGNAYFLVPQSKPEQCKLEYPLEWSNKRSAIRSYRIAGSSAGTKAFNLNQWPSAKPTSYWYVSNGVLSGQQPEIPLYAGPIPNSRKSTTPIDTTVVTYGNPPIDIQLGVNVPTLTVFLPERSKANGGAVIICPGGGYQILATSHEGSDMARRFNEEGVAAFVLRYRLPKDETMIDKSIGPLQDAQRTIQLVRERAAEWGLRTNRIGILGSSAGGHLASTAGTHWQKALIDNQKGTSLRPDFMILNYPVISFSDSLTHGGSRVSLIGKKTFSSDDHRYGRIPAGAKELGLADPDVLNYSNELQVDANTPPTFITAPLTDKVVPVGNTFAFAAALQQNKVPVETFVYAAGEHGYGMINPAATEQWMENCIAWMKRMDFIPQNRDWANLGRFESQNERLGPVKEGEERVVFMGNSITEGWSNLDPGFFKDKPFVNRGISGQTTPQMLIRFRPDVIDLRPSVVVILAGTNDIAGNTGPMTLEQTRDNIISMCELARSNNIRVVLCSVLPAFDFGWSPGREPAEKIVRLNGMLRAYADKQGIPWVDYHTPMKDERNGLRKEYGEDGVHPNQSGYRAMEPLVEEGIRKALGQK